MDENGTQTWTLYDGSDPVMDFNGSGSLETRYLNGPTGQLVDTVLARESSGGTIAWYLPDRLGTVRDLISNSGAIIDHVDYSAFGTVLDESSPTSGDRMMGFAGMERDSVTGLNLAVYRAENPGTGRWTSVDPLGFAAGDSDLYRYVGNNVAGASDPDGLNAGQEGTDIFRPVPHPLDGQGTGANGSKEQKGSTRGREAGNYYNGKGSNKAKMDRTDDTLKGNINNGRGQFGPKRKSQQPKTSPPQQPAPPRRPLRGSFPCPDGGTLLA